MNGRWPRVRWLVLLGVVAALALAACGGDEEAAAPAEPAPAEPAPAEPPAEPAEPPAEPAETGEPAAPAEGEPQPGGDVIIARVADSTSMDKTTVFDNESIWVFQQVMESLFAVTPDGKDVEPWLAEGFELSDDQLTYTIALRQGVLFHNGQEMTSADVKFSIDEASSVTGGWEWINAAIESIETPDPYTVVVKTKYPWSPMIADLALFNNAIIPADYAGETKEQFYEHPIGTGPFVWDHWTKGSDLKLVRNDNYWQEGKPYLDSVTWTVVGDDNTRILQLKGGQIQINEFPPFSSIADLQATEGVVMELFPSTRTDYLLFNHNVEPLNDVHVRRAISMAIDRQAMVDSILFGNGEPANSFMPPQVPYYDPESPGLQFDLEAAQAEMAQSSVPDGFDLEYLLASGDVVDESIAAILQQSLEPLGINVTIKKLDPTTQFAEVQKLNYSMAHSYWTMDIADPDELVTFAIDPDAGSHAFFTDYRNEEAIAATKAAQSTFEPAEREALYSEIQTIAAEDAFMVFLYYSPYRYAFSDTVNGFVVYPTGNYHMEDVWLSQ
jgi:peptide/nickel transport system substrate-binding protein